MTNQRGWYRFLSVLWIMVSYTMNAIDNPHFYRANFFWDEPRLEKPWLTSINCILGGGGTRKAYNSLGQKTPLLNIFGLQNLKDLGKNVAGLNPQNPLDELIIQVGMLPERDNFGKVLLRGEFNSIETILNAYQNFCKGFFMQAYLPIRKLQIKNIQLRDESPDDTIFPNRNLLIWRSFFDNLPLILQQHGRSLEVSSESGIGDLSFLCGWTTNYQETEYLDFIDVTAKIGILFPTGKRSSVNTILALPLGYDGFYGFPFKFDCAVGYWEWLTVGCHLGALFLFNKQKNIAVKTAQEQNGLIYLTTLATDFDPGTIWDVAGFFKADHFFKGFSVYVGYCYTQKDADCYVPVSESPDLIIYKDLRFQGWNMHVLHFIAEYDFAQHTYDIGPRLALFYNHLIKGKRVFNTSFTSGGWGVDISWCF